MPLDPATLLAYTLAVLVLSLAPGPDMALFVGQAIARGRAAGFAAFAGTAGGLVVHAVAAAVGLSALIAASATAFLVMKVAGALWLLWLAVEAVRRGSAFQPAAGAEGSLVRIAAKGFAVNVLNPKIVLFFLTFLPQFVDPADPHAAAKLLVLGLWYIPVTLVPTAALILAAAAVARILQGARVRRALDYAFAGVMGAFALRLLAARPG